MNSKRILARAPSNIAIVKYMGKRDPERNLPANPSLSMTLKNLCTYVELRAAEGGGLRIVREVPAGARGQVPNLSQIGEEKFLGHLSRVMERAPDLLRQHGLMVGEAPAHAEVRTTNTFPSSAGIASSASSFAALTLAATAYHARDAEEFRLQYAGDPELRRALAALSREGSGSSCRSFEGPFVAWDEARTERIESALQPLSDLVIVVSAGEKKIGSTEAHRRVRTSPNWEGRTTRAENRYRDLKNAIAHGNFAGLAEIAEADYRDMHRLFETSNPPFSYFAPRTNEVLGFLAGSPGIAVTMDAGPNVHVIVPQSEEEFWRAKISARFPELPLLIDREGTGAEFVVFAEGVSE
jgi:diphosphomevalonate decarboxylase